jgi:phosphate-selective porin OprO/OprP
MRKQLVIVAVISVLIAWGSASAEEEAPPPAPKVDLAKGLTFSSGDNSVSIGARIQFRGTFDDREQFDADDDGTGLGVEDGTAGQFDIPRARVSLKGGFWKPWLKYELQWELSRTSGDSSSKLKDAVLEIHGNRMAVWKLGQFKSPFSLQQLISSGRQQFVDRAITDGKFAPGRDTGISLNGSSESKKFGYGVGVFNGSGESRVQDDEGFMTVGRLWFDPLGEYKMAESAVDGGDKPVLHLGVGARTGEVQKGTFDDDVFEDPDDETALNFEAAFRSGPFSLAGEYFTMTNEMQNPAVGADLDSDGFYVQAGFLIVPNSFEIGLRYAMVDPDNDATDASITETRAVLGYYWKGHNLKLQGDIGQVEYEANYDLLSSLARRGLPSLGNRLVTGQDLSDKQARIQLQLAF